MSGDTKIAVIIGSIVGGCCVIFLIYVAISYCIKMREKKIKKERKKKRKMNRVGASESDSDFPKEPIVVHPDMYDRADFRVESSVNNSNIQMIPTNTDQNSK